MSTTFTALRPYQTEALAAVVDHVDRGARRLVLAIPTGGGKTIIFSSLAEALALGAGQKILILAHRDELVAQARDKYLLVNPHELVGIEKANQRATPMDRVCVASVQTLRDSRLADFKSRWGVPALIITDEAHHSVASQYTNIYEYFGVSAKGEIIHVGVTATPKRSDNVGLDKTYDVVAYSKTIGELITDGYLVPLVGYRCQTNTNLDVVKTLAGDFNQGQLATAVDTPERNARIVQAYQDITPGRKAVVFAASVAHSINLRDMFVLAGFTAAHLDGTTPDDERKGIIGDFGMGKYDVLTNCAVLTEGWDEPTLEVVMIARPTKSTVLYAQMVGRATRLYPGKTKAAVIDFVDASKRHSVISLPSLLGLPPAFNLGGRNATATAAKYQALMQDNPLLSHLVTDVAMLNRLSALDETQRMSALVQHLMEQARETNTYVSVDMMIPPPMPSIFDDMTYMVWTPMGGDSYKLRLKDETVSIVGDLVGKYSISVAHKHREPTSLGIVDHIRFAFAKAELWVRNARGDESWTVDKGAKWRKDPASDKQRAALKFHRISGGEQMTKHEASTALDTIMMGLASGTMHAPRTGVRTHEKS